MGCQNTIQPEGADDYSTVALWPVFSQEEYELKLVFPMIKEKEKKKLLKSGCL